MFTFGMLYWLFPRLFKTELYSKKLANQHFWIATLGILLYAIPMYYAGFAQGLMWQEFNPDGTLTYQDFLETVQIIKPFYILRSLGGLLFIIGAVMMFYNLVKTAKSGKLVANEDAEATVTKDLNINTKGEYWHRKIERKPVRMMLFAIIVVAIGGLVQIVPTMIVKSNIPTISSVKPYTPLELEGRDIYIKEGCYNCHSQMIRPLRFETARYGDYSKAGEFVYDHPFQWGSKRTGPDLAREGGNIKIKKSNFWHYQHLIRPKDVSKGSIMPAYVWLKENDLPLDLIEKKINAMRTLGVPYAKGYEKKAKADLQKQALEIATDIINNQPVEILKIVNVKDEIKKLQKKEIISLIAYLQRLGKDVSIGTTINNK
jgi:cytochrome c oxidase cbb3-type subunit I/II